MVEPNRPSTEFIDVLARELPTGVEVALLDFPWHDNPGDAAIWRGEQVALSALGHRIVYLSTSESLDPRRLRSVLPPESPILLHGGGNLGDIWPAVHAHRMFIIRNFQDRRIVQLPQTVHFEDLERGAESLAELARHPNLLAMARDRDSLDELKSAGIGAVLCKDPSTALGLHKRHACDPPIGSGPLHLLRKDSERTRTLSALRDVDAKDWSDFDIASRAKGTAHCLDRALDAIDRIERLAPLEFPWTSAPRNVRYRRFSDRLIHGALSVIDRFEFVITDRLHGLLLALSSDRPVIAIDSGYGKLNSYIDTFLVDEPLIHRISDPDDIDEFDAALEEIRGLDSP